MRLIRSQSTNLRSIRGSGVKYDSNDQVIMDSKTGALLPKGRENDRPFYPENGYIRYNTDSNELEVYQNGAWREVRFKEPNRNPGIVQQNLGVGDASETDFGPLNSQDPEFPVPEEPQNILVFIENVFQIATTNYELVQNPGGKTPGWYIRFGAAVPLGKPVTVLHNFDK
jgi:hypothetical protein